MLYFCGMLTMELNISNCKVEGNNIIYTMTSSFTKFFLDYKQNKAGVYPPYIDVKGNKILRFEYTGWNGGFYVYECGEFKLKIKYKKKGEHHTHPLIKGIIRKSLLA